MNIIFTEKRKILLKKISEIEKLFQKHGFTIERKSSEKYHNGSYVIAMYTTYKPESHLEQEYSSMAISKQQKNT